MRHLKINPSLMYIECIILLKCTYYYIACEGTLTLCKNKNTNIHFRLSHLPEGSKVLSVKPGTAEPFVYESELHLLCFMSSLKCGAAVIKVHLIFRVSHVCVFNDRVVTHSPESVFHVISN